MQRLRPAVVTATLALFAIPAGLACQECSGGIAGAWNTTATLADGARDHGSLDVNEDGSGVLTSSSGVVRFNGDVDGDRLRVSFPVEPFGTVMLDVRACGDRLEGTIIGDGIEGQVTGTRHVVTARAASAAPSTGEPFFADDFDNGRRNGAGGFRWLDAGSAVEVVEGVSHSGDHSLRFSYAPVEPNGDAHWWAEQRFQMARNAASAPRELWMEYMLRVPDNWHHRDGPSSDNNKFLLIWAERDEPGNVKFGAEFSRAPGGASRLRVVCYLGGVGCLEGTSHANIFEPSMRGQWVRIRVHLRAGRDGTARVWRDGQLVYSHDTAFMYAGGNNYWRHGYLMGYDNSGYHERVDYHIDDFRLYDNDPGW